MISSGCQFFFLYFSIALNNLHICSLLRTFVQRERERGREEPNKKKTEQLTDERTKKESREANKKHFNMFMFLCVRAPCAVFLYEHFAFHVFFFVTGADFTAWGWFFCAFFFVYTLFFNIYILRSILPLRSREVNVKRRTFQRLRPINRWCVFPLFV